MRTPGFYLRSLAVALLLAGGSARSDGAATGAPAAPGTTAARSSGSEIGRIPLPGARVEGGQRSANVAYPGLVICYTTDGSEPTAESTAYSGPVAVSGVVKLEAFDTRGRDSRTSVVDPSGG
jgi:hypothetical protein